jgi:hypothetical protein
MPPFVEAIFDAQWGINGFCFFLLFAYRWAYKSGWLEALVVAALMITVAATNFGLSEVGKLTLRLAEQSDQNVTLNSVAFICSVVWGAIGANMAVVAVAK